MRKYLLNTVVASLLLGGCVSHSNNVNPDYVSPSRYAAMSCDQLEEERLYIGNAVARVSDQQDDAADADAVLLGVGAILFWPALLAMPFNEDQAHELSRLKGEYEAVSRAQDQNGCRYSHMTTAGNEEATPEAAPETEPATTLVTTSETSLDAASDNTLSATSETVTVTTSDATIGSE